MGATDQQSARRASSTAAAFAGDAHFSGRACLNCGEALQGRYCSACGQKKVGRLGLPDLRAEAWQKLRMFELDVLKASLGALLQPGRVARAFVLGERKKHMHPLALLLSAVVALLLMLDQTGYLATSQATLSKALELVRAYSKWSFTLGLFAILIASLAIFRNAGFNLVEHLVLAAYTQVSVILANVLNLAPLLFWRGAEAVAAHKAASGWYMNAVETAIVAFAYFRFFRLDVARGWWRVALAGLLFFLAKKMLIYLYARAVIRIVMLQLA